MYMQFDNMPTLDPNNQRPLNLFEHSNIEISPSSNLSNFPFTFESTVPTEDGMIVDNNAALNSAFNFNAADLWGLSFEGAAFKPTVAFPAAPVENALAPSDLLGADPLKSFVEQASTAARMNRLNHMHQVMFNNITQAGAGYVPEDNYSASSQNDSPTTQNQSSPDYILHFPEFEDIEMNEEKQTNVVVKVEKTEQHSEEATSSASTPSTASSSSSPINNPPTTTTTQPPSQPKKKESLLEKIVKIEKAGTQQPKKRGRKPKKDYDYIQDDEEDQMKDELKEEQEHKTNDSKRASQSSSSGDDDDEEKYETTDVGLKLLKRGKKRSRTEEQIDRDRLEQLLKKKNSQLTKKEKEEKRVLRNRFTAKISREKRKQENQELVQQNVRLAEENQKLKDDLKSLKEENASLKKKLQQSQFLLNGSAINATTSSEMRSGGISLFSVSILVVLSLGIFIYPFLIAARISGTTGLEVIKESNQRIELLLAKMKSNIQNSQYHWNQSSIIRNAEDKKVKVKSRTLKACKIDDPVSNKKELIHHLKTHGRFMKERLHAFRHRIRKQEEQELIEINPQKPVDQKKNKKNRWDRFYNVGDEEEPNNEMEFVINPKTQISLFFPKFTPIDFSNISKNDYFANSRLTHQFGSNI